MPAASSGEGDALVGIAGWSMWSMWTAGVKDGVVCSPGMPVEGISPTVRRQWTARSVFRFGLHCAWGRDWFRGKFRQRGEKVCHSDIVDTGAEGVEEGQRELFPAYNDASPGWSGG